MPMFEFKCKECGHEFEDLVLSAKSYKVTCPECSSSNVEKKLSSFAAGSSSAGGSCAPSG